MKISIITCTYNPDSRIIGRTLAAVEQLVIPANTFVEYIIVDNNSNPAFATRPEFHSFLSRNEAWVQVIKEEKPGLSNARIAGLRRSKGDLIIFFDDDNEPEKNYLEEVLALRESHPDIAIWSPGNVWVEFIGDADPWTRENALEKLQELHLEEIKTTSTDRDFPYMPYGTGMIVERAILEGYASAYESGTFTATDRSGQSLSSAGDIQIVFSALNQQKGVGRAPQLRLRHLISESKSSFDYIKRLYYGCSIEGFSVHAQSFVDEKPEEPAPFRDTLLFAAYNTYYLLQMALVQGNTKKWICQSAGMIATIEGKYQYHGKPLPLYMRLLKKKLSL